MQSIWAGARSRPLTTRHSPWPRAQVTVALAGAGTVQLEGKCHHPVTQSNQAFCLLSTRDRCRLGRCIWVTATHLCTSQAPAHFPPFLGTFIFYLFLPRISSKDVLELFEFIAICAQQSRLLQRLERSDGSIRIGQGQIQGKACLDLMVGSLLVLFV